ncbi:NPCBM/NEW2 domain-containing protein [Nonomuraea helvata]|uniref:NPCBM/NEW2 domain-containing protein n=1 Tax=Nonomuraea helvata TaxID=37484 RepID=A0ABV5S1H3_9ACTN
MIFIYGCGDVGLESGAWTIAMNSSTPPDSHEYGSAGPTPESVVQYLRELTPVAGGPVSESADVNGERYVNSITLSPNSPWQGADMAEYNLSRDWRRFRAVLGVRDDAPADAKARVEIFGDGKRLYRKDFSLGRSDRVDIDVSHVLRLKLQTTTIAGVDVYSVVFGDSLLVK